MKKDATTDQELIEQAKAGSDAAFRRLVLRYEVKVRSTIQGMIGPGPQVDDIAQEVFVRFYGALANFRGEAAAGTYLVRIAINLSLNEVKRLQRQREKTSFPGEEGFRSIANQHTARADQFDLQDLLQQAIQQLAPEARSVVVLRLVDGYSVSETAKILKLPQGTVASRLSRAQQQLRQWLTPVWKNE